MKVIRAATSWNFSQDQLEWLEDRIKQGILESVRAERESCALIADEGRIYHWGCASQIANTIRARSNND